MWRTIVADLLDRGAAGVFLCNVFRQPPRAQLFPHLGGEEAVRERIRRFNLMAIEVSHDTQAYLVDFDRALAEVGARALQTDCCLGGELTAVVAGEVLASTLLRAGLDEVCPAEVQEAATAHVVHRRAVRNWLAARPAAIGLLAPFAKAPPPGAETALSEREARLRGEVFAAALERSKCSYLIDNRALHNALVGGLQQLAEGFQLLADATARQDERGQTAARERIVWGNQALSPFRKALEELAILKPR
jgi:hypothetical protein